MTLAIFLLHPERELLLHGIRFVVVPQTFNPDRPNRISELSCFWENKRAKSLQPSDYVAAKKALIFERRRKIYSVKRKDGTYRYCAIACLLPAPNV